jgi:hypothetical protein
MSEIRHRRDRRFDRRRRHGVPALFDRNAASGSPAMTNHPHPHPHPLDLLYKRTCVLADRVTGGELLFLDAIDMGYSAACWAGLVARFGEDAVQATLAAAFMNVRRSGAA